ncbi:hypothetical protein ABT282_08810 [Streptomyces sp. NPDC000927]|uniref:hypothetical protein n=1 Tax=Streptomyces sp. NPDC000927 TaxID=3154371 RepID=UPI003333D340
MPETFEGVVGYCIALKGSAATGVKQKNFSLNGENIKFFIAFRDQEGFDLIKNGARLKVWIRPGSRRVGPDGHLREIIDRAVLVDTGKEIPVDSSVTVEEFAQDGLF